jgi:hypothetical protein
MVDPMDFHSGHSLSSIVITFQPPDAVEVGSPEVTSAELLIHSEAAFLENDSASGRWEENSPPLSWGCKATGPRPPEFFFSREAQVTPKSRNINGWGVKLHVSSPCWR